jgi:hypothetical protein
MIRLSPSSRAKTRQNVPKYAKKRQKNTRKNELNLIVTASSSFTSASCNIGGELPHSIETNKLDVGP